MSQVPLGIASLRTCSHAGVSFAFRVPLHNYRVTIGSAAGPVTRHVVVDGKTCCFVGELHVTCKGDECKSDVVFVVLSLGVNVRLWGSGWSYGKGLQGEVVRDFDGSVIRDSRVLVV